LLKDVLIGICGLYIHTEEKSKHRAEIIQMYVQPEYQGNTIGFYLLEETVRIGFECKDVEQIELEVMTDVKAANKIYEKIGFKECGVRQHFYKKNEKYFDQRLMILLRK